MKYQKATEEEAMVAAKRYAMLWRKPAYVAACGPMFTIEPVAPFFKRSHYIVYPNGATEFVAGK